MMKPLTTKEKILETARQLFWTRGYSNVSVRDITGAAGVDAALVSRYFGGKQGLFEAVLRASMERYERAQAEQWQLPEDDPMFFIKGMETLFRWYENRKSVV